MSHDYSEFKDEMTGDNALAALRAMAEEQHEAELAVGIAEAQLVEAKDRLRVISEQKLPELMEELGVPYFETSDGLKIEIKESTHVSMGKTPEEKNEALDWLEKNGHGHLIKRTVEVPFGKGMEKDASELVQELNRVGRRASYARKVEPMTLKAFVVERLKAGEEVPLELFHVHQPKSSKVTLA